MDYDEGLAAALSDSGRLEKDVVRMLRVAQRRWGDVFTPSIKVATCVYRFMRARGMQSVAEWNILVEAVAHRACAEPGSYAVIRSLAIEHRESRGFRPIKFNLQEGSGICFGARPKYCASGSGIRLKKILEIRRRREEKECDLCQREMVSTTIRWFRNGAIPRAKIFEGVREHISQYPKLCNSCWKKVKPICIAAHEANEIRRLTNQLQRERSNAKQKSKHHSVNPQRSVRCPNQSH